MTRVLHCFCDDVGGGAVGVGDDVALVLGGEGERCGEEDERAGGELHFLFWFLGVNGGGMLVGCWWEWWERERETDRQCAGLGGDEVFFVSCHVTPMIVRLETIVRGHYVRQSNLHSLHFNHKHSHTTCDS